MNDQRLVRVLKALADAHRFRMVQVIAAAGELSCGEVGDRFRLAQPTISHHLKILTDAGVLHARREGQHAILSVNHDLVNDAIGWLPKRLRTQSRRQTARAGSRT